MRKLLIFFALLIALGLAYWIQKKHFNELEFYDHQSQRHEFAIAKANVLYGFDLLDPEQSPPEIHQHVMHGYHIFMNTPYYAPEYCKNQLSCTNCHFCGGDTVGTKNTGISLVGVTTEYPRFSKRDNKIISLSDRICNCFQRSMNGIAPPIDSYAMHCLLTYFKWISKEVEYIQDIPWLGIHFIKSDHKPDPVEGEKVYLKYCADCHKADGEGGAVLGQEGKTIPPIWGPHSFNDGAGMSRQDMFSGFVYWNMPYQNANLTKEEALDVTSYVLMQPRAHFVNPK